MITLSVSEVRIEFEFEDGLILTGILDRVKGPLIIEDIKASLPFEGRSALIRGELKITMGLGRGNLKATHQSIFASRDSW